MPDEIKILNFAVFRDCFSSAILQKVSRTTPKNPRRSTGRGSKSRKNANRATGAEPGGSGKEQQREENEEELADFVEVSISLQPEDPPF